LSSRKSGWNAGFRSIRIEDALPVSFFEFDCRLFQGDSSGIDENVDLAEVLERLVVQRLDGRAVCDIARDAQGFAAERLDSVATLSTCSWRARNWQRHRTGLRQAEGDSMA